MVTMSAWTIDENFNFDEGERDGAHGRSGYTWAEFCAKTPPPCPGCGDPVDITPIYCRDGSERDLFIPGTVRCLNGCQPGR